MNPIVFLQLPCRLECNQLHVCRQLHLIHADAAEANNGQIYSAAKVCVLALGVHLLQGRLLQSASRNPEAWRPG